MSDQTINTPALIKRAQSRFISIDEICIENLSMYAMAVYMQLRLLSDFSKVCDEIKITIQCLAEKSKMSIRKVYEALNELEHNHFIIQRLNYHHFRYGQVNSFNVARDYEYFKNKQNDQSLTTPAQNDMGVQTLTTPAPYAVATAPGAGGTAQKDIPNTTRSLSTVNPKKQNKETVSVFSDTESVKTHLFKIIANRKVFVEDGIIEQGIYYAFEKNSDKSFDSVNKRLNIFLKKVREGKWLIPQGWNGITSQSIRENEEQKSLEKKQLYAQEAQVFQSLTGTVAKGDGLKSFSAMFQKLKDDINGTHTNPRSMQA